MLSIVMSYLLQSGSCALPGLGEFVITTKPAELDIVHKQIHPPVDEIIFTENDAATANPNLVKYIAARNGQDEETAGLILNNYCEEWKKAISIGDVISLHTFGTLQKNAVGNIFFRKISPELIFRHPVTAERVIHENADHPILVGDKETSSNRMTDYYAETEPVKKGKFWAIWAATLALAAVIFLVFYFKQNGFSANSTGNKSGIVVDTFSVERITQGLK